MKMLGNNLLGQPIEIDTIKKIAVAAGPLSGLNITAPITDHDRLAKVNLPFIGEVKQKAWFGLTTLAWCFQRLGNSKRVMWTKGNIPYFTADRPNHFVQMLMK